MFIEVVSQFIVPIAILMVFASILVVAIIVIRNTHIASPNQVAVISGTKRKVGDGDATRGYRIVTGGRFFLMPVLEKVDFIFLNLMTFNVEVKGVPSKEGAPVTVSAVANVKVKSEAEALALVIERFLGMRPEQIQAIAKENLESNLRSIVGTMTVEDLVQNRQLLLETVLKEAVSDLAKMGLAIDLFNVQNVTDDGGYILALGKTRTAQVMRDAARGKAEADKEAEVAVQGARRVSETAKADSTKAISSAEKDRDVVKATNAAEVAAADARVKIAGEIAAANATAELNVATVNAQMKQVEADTELQNLELKRNTAKLEATTITTARKGAEAAVITAEGHQRAAVAEGEAERIRKEKAGQGDQAEKEGQAKGRMAIAGAVQREREAEAAGNQATLLAAAAGKEAELLAVASGIRASSLAEAEGIRAKLLAEAEGILKKAEAYAKLDANGRFLLILETAAPLITAIGDAAGKALTPPAEAIGAGLANISEVRIIDAGGNPGSDSALERYANTPITALMKIVEEARAAGFGSVVEDFAKRAGVNLRDWVPPAKDE